MLIMGIFIYFDYTKVYETDVELFTVKILGLPIYQLTKMGDSYVGESRGLYGDFLWDLYDCCSYYRRALESGTETYARETALGALPLVPL